MEKARTWHENVTSDEDEDTSETSNPILPVNGEASEDDEDLSEMDSIGRLSDADGEDILGASEDDSRMFHGPGDDFQRAGVYFPFRRVDVSEIWQGLQERFKDPGESEKSSTDVS